MAELCILVSTDMLDAYAARLRAEGVECTLAPPCGLRVACELDRAQDDDAFFPGITDATSERIVAALLGTTHDKLTNTLLCGFNAGLLPCYPHRTLVGEGGLRVLHTTITSMLYNAAHAPDTVPCAVPGFGGAWVLSRIDEAGGLVPLAMSDDELLPAATALMRGGAAEYS